MPRSWLHHHLKKTQIEEDKVHLEMGFYFLLGGKTFLFNQAGIIIEKGHGEDKRK
ncbi:hypothetical protein CHS0354_004472, partial [Potamilus streckersoni]